MRKKMISAYHNLKLALAEPQPFAFQAKVVELQITNLDCFVPRNDEVRVRNDEVRVRNDEVRVRNDGKGKPQHNKLLKTIGDTTHYTLII